MEQQNHQHIEKEYHEYIIEDYDPLKTPEKTSHEELNYNLIKSYYNLSKSEEIIEENVSLQNSNETTNIINNFNPLETKESKETEKKQTNEIIKPTAKRVTLLNNPKEMKETNETNQINKLQTPTHIALNFCQSFETHLNTFNNYSPHIPKDEELQVPLLPNEEMKSYNENFYLESEPIVFFITNQRIIIYKEHSKDSSPF